MWTKGQKIVYLDDEGNEKLCEIVDGSTTWVMLHDPNAPKEDQWRDWHYMVESREFDRLSLYAGDGFRWLRPKERIKQTDFYADGDKVSANIIGFLVQQDHQQCFKRKLEAQDE